MKILHILLSARAEGTPRLVLDWLTKKEHEQHVLFLNNFPVDLLENFNLSAASIYINNSTKNNFLSRVKYIPKVVKKISSQIKPDLVICWNQANAHLITLGAKMAKTKRIIIHAGCAPEKHPQRGYFYDYFVYFPVYLMKGKVVCASEHIKNTFQNIRFFPKSILYKVSNCIQVEKFILNQKEIENKKQTLIAVFVANLEETKEHEILINSWKLVIQQIPEAKLWLVGRGSLESKLKNQVEILKLEENIKFLGPRNDVPELLKQADLFVFSSNKNEGFGTVLVEALASGLKIVSFDEPAPNEVLQNGKYGVLVKNRNVEDFANAIIENFNFPISQDQINENIVYSKSFSVEQMMNQYIQIALQ